MHPILFLLAVALAANAARCPSPSYSFQGADTIVLRNLANGLKAGATFITHEHSVAWRAMEMVYNVTQNSSYVEHMKAVVDNVVTGGGGLMIMIWITTP